VLARTCQLCKCSILNCFSASVSGSSNLEVTTYYLPPFIRIERCLSIGANAAAEAIVYASCVGANVLFFECNPAMAVRCRASAESFGQRFVFKLFESVASYHMCHILLLLKYLEFKRHLFESYYYGTSGFWSLMNKG
jgi:hypothetical protein